MKLDRRMEDGNYPLQTILIRAQANEETSLIPPQLSHPNIENLPPEIIFGIFSRLPVKSLLRLQCVCKLWRDIVDDPYLVNLHLSQAKEEPGMLVLTKGSNSGNSDVFSMFTVGVDRQLVKTSNIAISQFRISKRYTLMGSCNGLLCFARNCNVHSGIFPGSQAFLCNPLRAEVLSLPAITESPVCFGQRYGVGFDSSTREYKVIRVYFSEFDLNEACLSLGCEVHTLGTKSWRQLQEVPPYPICGTPVFASRALHWLIDPILAHQDPEGPIISFDIEKEKFSITTHPDISPTGDYVQIVEMKRCLSLVDLSSDTHIDIWVMKDYARKQWIREYKIMVNAPDFLPNNGDISVLGFWEHGEILLKSSTGHFFSYNPTTDELTYVHISGLPPDAVIFEVYVHTGSLVSFKDYNN